VIDHDLEDPVGAVEHDPFEAVMIALNLNRLNSHLFKNPRF
jgi:hypothetical protein